MPPESRKKEKIIGFSSSESEKKSENDHLSKELKTALDIYRPSAKEYKILLDSISDKLNQRIEIPASIFKTNLAPLESLVTYLRNSGITNKRISELLNRSKKTISQAYKKELIVKETEEKYKIPVKNFSDRKLSILEVIVWHLRQNTVLTLHEIAELLGRDDRTIWTVNSRAKKKRGEGQ